MQERRAGLAGRVRVTRQQGGRDRREPAKSSNNSAGKKLTTARVDLKKKQEQDAKKIKLLEKAREAVAAAEEAEKGAKTAEETAQAAATAAGSEYGAFKPGEHEEADYDEGSSE